MTIILYMYIMLAILENAFSSTNSIFTRTLGAELEKLKPKEVWGVAWGGDSKASWCQGLTKDASCVGLPPQALRRQNMTCLHVQKGFYFWGHSRYPGPPNTMGHLTQPSINRQWETQLLSGQDRGPWAPGQHMLSLQALCQRQPEGNQKRTCWGKNWN